MGGVCLVLQQAVLTGDGPLVWGPWAVSASMQGVVTALCLYFDCCHRRGAAGEPPKPTDPTRGLTEQLSERLRPDSETEHEARADGAHGAGLPPRAATPLLQSADRVDRA